MGVLHPSRRHPVAASTLAEPVSELGCSCSFLQPHWHTHPQMLAQCNHGPNPLHLHHHCRAPVLLYSLPRLRGVGVTHSLLPGMVVSECPLACWVGDPLSRAPSHPCLPCPSLCFLSGWSLSSQLHSLKWDGACWMCPPFALPLKAQGWWWAHLRPGAGPSLEQKADPAQEAYRELTGRVQKRSGKAGLHSLASWILVLLPQGP